MENQQINRRRKRMVWWGRAGLSALLCCFCFSLGAGSAQAAVEQDSGKTVSASASKEATASDSTETLVDLLQTYFTYQRENRSDPFATFIKKETPKITRAGYEPEEEVLTGMQLFEPGQLSLVSIVFSEDRTFAMVEDSVGQGYIVEKGTKIGRRGVVEDIIPNVVIIKQWSMTFAGEKRYKNIEMVLRKEGE